MSSGGEDGYSSIQRWNEEAATLESFDQRVKLFVSSTKKEERYLCGPRLLSTFDPEGGHISIRRCLDDCQDDTSLSWSQFRKVFGRLLLDFFRLDSLRRNYEKP